MKKKVLILTTFDTFFIKDLLVDLIKNCEKTVEFKFFIIADYTNFMNIIVKLLSFGLLRSLYLAILNLYNKLNNKCISDIFDQNVIKSKNLNEIKNEIKDIDLILSINYPKLIPKKILKLAKFGGVNHHLGKLPKYAGRYPVAKAIIAKDKKICITLHHLSKSFDSGKIISETYINISNFKNNFYLIYKKVFKMSLKPLTKVLKNKNKAIFIEKNTKIHKLKLIDFFKLYLLSNFKF